MNKKLRFFSGLISFVLLFIGNGAHAEVSLRNGNFYIGYTDFIFFKGLGLKLERTYNSKSAFLGMFGYGWGTDFETQGYVNPDGSFIIKESGGGAENIFEPVVFDVHAKAAAVDLIVSKNAANAIELADYRKRLRSDKEFFLDEWKRLIDEKKVSPFIVPTGSRLVSTMFGYQVLTKTRDGYERKYPNGNTETFDNQGRLVLVVDKNRNYLKIFYNDTGLIKHIEDNLSNKAYFFFNGQKLVDSIICTGTVNATCRYRYNDKSQLIYSLNQDGTSFLHDYDARHNMTYVGYEDSTSMIINYWGADLYENVRSVKDRDGGLSTYEYSEIKIGDREKKLTVTEKYFSTDSISIFTTITRFELRVTEEGEELITGLYTESDGDVTYTKYNDLGDPILRVNGEDTTRYRYNNKALLTSTETGLTLTEFQYHVSCLKKTRATETEKDTKKVTWTSFLYDSLCNIIRAENSEGDYVDIHYDANGIRNALKFSDAVINLEYNESDKIKRISTQQGSVIVVYDEDGDILKVEKETGSDELKILIMSLFSDYLELIKLAD